MENNRLLAVYTARSRKEAVLQAAPMDVTALFSKLSNSQALPMTHGEYMRLKKPKQDDLKDVGAYIAGELKGGQRRAGCVLSRSAAVLDADTLPAGGTEDFIRRVAALGLCCCVHSTAKHSPATPRLRAVFPFARDIPAEQYAPVVRLLCRMIQPELTWFDPTCDRVGQIMYNPTHCQDVEPVLFIQDKTLLNAGELLERDLPSWFDPWSWPQFSRDVTPANLAAKQEDPTAKTGIVGAFCRAYDVPDAMDKFLPGVYEETATGGRYTFTGGSTWGGAVLYDNGKFLYSHHATDPAGGKLTNAWDLVRIHRFGELDDEAEGENRGNNSPSFRAMVELVRNDALVADQLNTEREKELREDFGDPVDSSEPVDVTWMRKLTRTGNGSIERTSANVLYVLENDPRLKGRVYLDTFADKVYGIAPLPWGNHAAEAGPFEWKDADDDGLGIYLERLLGFRSSNLVRGALNDHLTRCAVNPVSDYLESLQWDGVPRMDALFIDYLGAEDTLYTRAVTRKAFTAAVARVLSPGCKYDFMLILAGKQGTFKSSTLSIMGGEWFTDSLMTFNGKDAAEVIQGKWIVEIAELQAFSSTDVNRIKQFLSSQNDNYRAAYGHRTSDHPRRCVFFGTTNARTFLRDPTGGRRFWPVYTGVQAPAKNVWTSLPRERDQIWAEAVDSYKRGEALYLSGELWKAAERIQEAAREDDPREGMLLDFLEKPVPKDWQSWTIERRQNYWNGIEDPLDVERELVPRDRVCAVEIWCELFQQSQAKLTKKDTRDINAILENAPGWERITYPAKFGPYGSQRGFQSTFWSRLQKATATNMTFGE